MRQPPLLLLLRLLAGAACWLALLQPGRGGLRLAAAQDTLESYPLDWSAVPADPPATTDLSGSCICALLNATCTPHCCCDPLCPAAAVAAFKAAGSCLPEGPPPEQLAYCRPAEPFAKVNLPAGDFYRLGRAQAAADLATQLLCIAADHNPALGAAYPDPAVGDVGANAQQVACTSPSDATTAAAAAAAAAAAPSYSYPGQAVVVVAPAAGGGAARGPLALPAAGVSSECIDGLSQVGFMARLPASLKARESSCQRTVASPAALAALCAAAGPASPLSPLFFSQLQFAAAPGATQLLPVVVARLSRLNASTGALAALDPDSDLAAPVAAAGAAQACNGVVVGAHLLLRHASPDDATAAAAAAAGALLSGPVSLSLVVADVAMPVGGGPLVIDTAFSVTWATAATPAAALQPLSGAPGYLPGFPLLAGRLTSDPATLPTTTAAAATAAGGGGDSPVVRTAVARFTRGLQLPGATEGGRCSTAAGGGGGQSIMFGYNASSSCSVPLTLLELRSFCQANDPTRFVKQQLGGLLQELLDHQVVVGVWGSADATNSHQWLPLHPSNWPLATDTSWDEPSATCSNILTGYDIKLLTGVAFAANNLQSKVLYAQLCFRYGSWAFNPFAGASSGLPAGAQPFPLTFTAAFLPSASQAPPTLALKPAPPLLAPLPPDLFYPFLTNRGGAVRAAGGWQRAVVLLGCGLLAQVAVGLLSC